MAFEIGGQMAGQYHEVVLDDAHDMEPVGHDAGVREVAPDDAAVGTGKVDADDFHALAALEIAEESGQIRGAFAAPDVKDSAVFQVAEGGAEALAFVQGVFVDAEVARAIEGKAFGSLADGELLIDAGDGGLSEFPTAGEGSGANAIVMVLIDVFPEGLGAMASGKNAGEARQETPAAGHAEEAVGVDDEACGLAEAVEVADGALVFALSEQLGSFAMRAASGPLESSGELDMDGRSGRLMTMKGVVTLQA